jgi:hypothetical protein
MYVSVAQLEPVWLNKNEPSKVISAIEQAAAEQSDLVARRNALLPVILLD